MNRAVSLVIAFLAVGSFAKAADIDGITVHGEAAFDYNMQSSASSSPLPNVEGATNEAYRFHEAQLLVSKDTEKFSFMAKLLYAPETYSTGSSTTTADLGMLKQIEAYYKPISELSLGFGRFLTTLGYESPLISQNANYTHSIAQQSIYPAYYDGLRVKYSPVSWGTLSVSTYNQADFATGTAAAPAKATEISIKANVEKLTGFVGYYFGNIGGPAGIGDVTSAAVASAWVSYHLLDNLSLAASYDSDNTKDSVTGQKTWSASTAVYATYVIGRNALSIRYEMIRGASAIGYTNGSDKVSSVTLTDKVTVTENLSAYVEYRMDSADQNSFANSSNNGTKSGSIFLLGAVASL